MRSLAWTLLLICACKKAPEISPQQEADGYYLKGQSEFLAGNLAEALTAFEEVRRLAPEDPRLPAALGEVFLQQAKWTEAEAQFALATTREPKRAFNWSRLSYAQAAQGKHDAAAAAVARALELNPKDFNALEQQAELLEAKEPIEAARLLTLAGKLAPEYRQGALFMRAYQLTLRSGKRVEARGLLEEAAKVTEASEVHATLGELWVREKNFEAAALAYERAAKSAPVTSLRDGGVKGDSTLWEILGSLYTRLERIEDAERVYREATRIDDRAVLHVALARLAFLRGDEAAAREELERALATAQGQEIRETLELASLLVEFGRKKDALLLLEHHASAEDGQRDADLQLRTAKLAQELGRKEVVAQACGRALGLDAGVVACP